MIRTFQTNKIRETRELSGSLWNLSPCAGEHKDEKYSVAVPCCWETVPDLSNYRGTGLFSRTMQYSLIPMEAHLQDLLPVRWMFSVPMQMPAGTMRRNGNPNMAEPAPSGKKQVSSV